MISTLNEVLPDNRLVAVGCITVRRQDTARVDIPMGRTRTYAIARNFAEVPH